MLERTIAAQSINHRLMTPLNDDDRAALTLALIKIVGSDRSEDSTNRIHFNNVIAHSR